MSVEGSTGPVIAVVGKGGVGKTTLSALLVSVLSREGGRRVLAVDADHAGGLTMALGLSPTRSLADVRVAAMDEAGSREVPREDLARSLDYQLLATLHEERGLALLPLGRPSGRGCYCAVNRLLREAVARLAGELDVTIVDAEAGLEQLSREVLAEVDELIVVADPSAKALAVARAAATLSTSRSLGVVAGLVVNRVRDAREAEAAAATAGIPLLCAVPEDEEVRRADVEGRSFLDLGRGPAPDAVRALAERLGLLGPRRGPTDP